MRENIKLPKDILTLEQFEEWVKNQNTNNQELEIQMKRRTNFYPYHFTKLEFGERVHYLISDSVSTGISHVKNFNRIFTFKLNKF